MVSKLQYFDYFGKDTVIKWFDNAAGGISTIYHNYVHRVVTDGGTLVSPKCVLEELENMEGAVEFCGQGDPMTIKYDSALRSEFMTTTVTVNLMVENDTQKQAIDKLLERKHYLTVEKDGDIKFIGVMFPRFFTEPYHNYPYELTLTATDAIARLKELQPLMVDYPDPMQQTEVRMIDVVAKSLETLSKNIFDIAPTTLRVSSRVFSSQIPSKGIEESVIDQKVFMKADSSEYDDLYTMLTDLFKAYNMFLSQHNGIYYLIDKDYGWDDGKIDYTEYNIISGRAVKGLTGTENDGDVISLYGNKQCSEINAGSDITYLAPITRYTQKRNYQQVENSLDAFANREGKFYSGHDGEALEFLTDGSRLRNWTDNDNGIIERDYGYMCCDLNSGAMAIFKSSFSGSVQYETNLRQADINRMIVTLETSGRVSIANMETAFTFKFQVIAVVNGVDHWAEYHNDHWRWIDTVNVIELENGGKVTVDIGANISGSDSKKIRFIIDKPFFPHFNTQAILGKLTFAVKSDKWDAFKAVNEIKKVTVDRNGTEQLTDELKLGLPQTAGLGYWKPFNYSGVYKDSLTPLLVYQRDDIEPMRSVLHSSLSDIVELSVIEQYSTFTRILSGDYRNSSLTTRSIVRDLEGNYYKFTSGTMNDREQILTAEFTEFKGMRVSGMTIPCDFNKYDFNNDFCIERTI